MIWKQEVKKLIKHPLMWSLLVICLMFNMLLIWENIGNFQKELPLVHKEILEHGIDEQIYKESLNRYDGLDMVEMKNFKQEIYQYQPTGSYKKFIDKQYEALNKRVEEIVTSGEAEGMTYVGVLYRLHSSFYANMLRWVFLEMGLFIVFAILFLMDYERIHYTSAIVYSTNIGRKSEWIKWCVGMAVGLGIGLLLLFIMCIIWFRLIPYEGFWNTSISAALMTEPRGILLYPFITFQKMTILEYLFSTIVIGVFLVLILGMIAGIIQIQFQYSYLSFGGVVLLLLIGLNVSGYATQTWFDVVLSWNPANLWFRTGYWFMEGNLGSDFKGAEVVSVVVQLVVCGMIGRLGYSRFLKKDY